MVVAGPLNDFYKIDITNNTVTQITLSSGGTAISGSRDHTMVAIGTDIYIFGGYDNSGVLNDFYKIDTNTINLSTNSVNVEVLTHNFTSDPNVARTEHTMVAIGQGYIYIWWY